MLPATPNIQIPDCEVRAWGPTGKIDFIEIKQGRYGCKYLLVFVDIFSRWTETFPTKTETSKVVAKMLLEDILPRYGFPPMIGSDNGPEFMSKVSQDVTKFIGAD